MVERKTTETKQSGSTAEGGTFKYKIQLHNVNGEEV